MTEFISRKYGMEGYEIIIKTDSHEHYRETEDFARRLIDHSKPATNADRIRSMSDEELDCFLNKVTYGMDECPYEYGSEKALEWLQQPAEETDNG